MTTATVTSSKKTTTEGTTVTEKLDQTSDDELPRLEAYLKIWSKAVDTQMHFNEMSVRSRQLGLTFVVTALGLAALLISQGKDEFVPVIPGYRLPVSAAITLVAAGALWLVRTLDIGVYHRMLRGAVAFGEDFERVNLRERLGVLKGMTSAVSLFSRYEDVRLGDYTIPAETSPTYGYYVQREVRRLNPFTWNYAARPLKGWWGEHPALPLSKAIKVTAERKLRRFYTSTIIVLIVLAALMAFARGIKAPSDEAKVDEAKKAPPIASAVGAPSAVRLSGASGSAAR